MCSRMKPTVDYQHYLNLVSRSFSFCIERLNSPLKEKIGLSYLLFRVLDTIEDAKWDDQTQKDHFFNLFELSLNKPTDKNLDINWLSTFSQSIPEHEKELLKVTNSLFSDFQNLNEADKKSLSSALITMKNGMQHFNSANNELRLKNLKEVNQYCFFVAGIIGELLTNFISSFTKVNYSHTVYVNSFHFGLFLQKINILKDQLSDEKEGRFLVPNRDQLFVSLKQNSIGALRYLTEIPIELKEYRLFCAWSLFLGLSSLSFINSSWKSKLMSKIPRSLTLSLLSQVENLIDDNKSIEQFFIKLSGPLSLIQNQSLQIDSIPFNTNSTDDWFLKTYFGRLNINDLSALEVM